jgi:hypothetical protein
MGLEIVHLETEPENLQDTVLTVYHASMQTLGNTDTTKIIENHRGRAMVLNAQRA